MSEDLRECPFCGSGKLAMQFRQTRHGHYDAAIYCRKCYAYGARVRSEDLNLPPCDTRNESPTQHMKNFMKEAAAVVWNRRITNAPAS